MRKKSDKIIIIIFLIGAAVFLYPIISSKISSYYEKTAVSNYEVNVQKINEETVDAEIEKADEYNKAVISKHNSNFLISNHEDDSEYKSMLNINGIMGNIIIPKININLPIYHGTGEDVLNKGIGHMSSTSLPVGGNSTHAVLTGHSGLSTAKLFTDLDEVKIDDVFYIKVLGRTLTYKVDQIKVVEPYDTRDLTIVKDKDYVTLVTCTPYGINSHRLLVRGIRLPDEEAKNTSSLTDIKKADNTIIYIVLSAVVVCILLLVIIIKKKRKKSAKSIN